jgi:hypothetical protein
LKTAAKLLTIAGFVAGFATFASADTIWHVNATFSYNTLGNTATGTLELDPSLNMVTWNITVAGTNAAADNVYNPGDSISIYPDSTHIDFYDGSTNQYIDLYLQTGVTNAGGTINLLYGDGGASSNSTIVCAGCGTLVKGTVSTVPEPSSVYLFGGGAVLAGLRLVRRKRVRAS